MNKKMYEGLKVLDLTNNYAGPVSTAMLADYGAEVIHIEKPVLGDDCRAFAPMFEGVSTQFITANRGKKSLVLDLKDPRAVEIVKKLAKDADVLVESYRPGVMKKLGLGYEDIKAVNPAIIYCSVSAYGQVGPYSQRPGYDVIAQAVSGFMYMTGEPDGAPQKSGIVIGDWMAGLNAFGSINAALYYRSQTGIGQYIDINLVQTLTWACTRFDFMYTGKVEKRPGAQHATLCPYGVFTGNNNDSIIIAALSSNLWEKLCNVMGVPQYIDDPRYCSNDQRVARVNEVVEIIETWLKKFDDIKEVEKILIEAGIPCAKVNSPKDVFEDPHVNEAGWVIGIPTPERMTSVPVKYTSRPPYTFSEVKPEFRGAPELGENNHEILEGLGYTGEEVDQMETEWTNKVLAKKAK